MKRIIITIMVLVSVLGSASFVSAQQPPANPSQQGGPRGGNDRFGAVLDAVSEATGLEREEIVTLTREDGMTLAEIITANGGSLDAVQATIVASFTEAVNEELANLDERVSDLLNNPLPQGQRGDGGRGGRDGRRGNPILGAVIEEITSNSDLDGQAIREQAEAGATLGEIITTAGLDTNTIIASVTATAAERLAEEVEDGKLTQEEADERLAGLGEGLQNLMDGEFPAGGQRGPRGSQSLLLQAVASELGIEPQELREGLEEGTTLADYITANGGNVSNVSAAAAASAQTQIAEAVADGKLTQEEADEILGNLDDAIEQALNHEIGSRDGNRPPQGGDA